MLHANASTDVALTYDDIIFQARNRAYGAFDLRQHYRPTLSRAVGLGVGLFLLGVALPTLYDRFWPKETIANKEIMTQVTLETIKEQPAEKPIEVPPAEKQPAVKTVRNLPLDVLPDADVVEENPPATVEELKDATSGPVTAEGTGDIDVIAAPEATVATVQEKAVEVESKTEAPFVTVEQQPEYPGGMSALINFLGKNLNYPRQAASAGVSGRVFVSFIVNTDGSLTDIQILKGIGFGCDEEALRVMNKMPHWKPGKQSGRAVRVKYNLPIAFTLE
ncbi:energy transducer TonB [Spirosoma foliorum]|uniref:Energy transducer TonB n=1 Tax=Spirosoma foliorum TaxID=2710596 RepID=A0A7G5GPX2_9BACT|nr:energy transducer TonB [Spirosoma foliorum]QMW00914.1 energy transducer TonB [Spirosoma foliorum]